MLLNLEVAAMCKLHQAKVAVKEFFTNEQGDTNFISVIIILCVVVALAVVFRENIADIVNAAWKSIFKDTKDALGTSAGSGSKFE